MRVSSGDTAPELAPYDGRSNPGVTLAFGRAGLATIVGWTDAVPLRPTLTGPSPLGSDESLILTPNQLEINRPDMSEGSDGATDGSDTGTPLEQSHEEGGTDIPLDAGGSGWSGGDTITAGYGDFDESEEERMAADRVTRALQHRLERLIMGSDSYPVNGSAFGLNSLDADTLARLGITAEEAERLEVGSGLQGRVPDGPVRIVVEGFAATADTGLAQQKIDDDYILPVVALDFTMESRTTGVAHSAMARLSIYADRSRKLALRVEPTSGAALSDIEYFLQALGYVSFPSTEGGSSDSRVPGSEQLRRLNGLARMAFGR